MSFISNYHTHNHYCDGENTMEEMVLAAINKGIKYLGISSHAPIINEESWTIQQGAMDTYLGDILYLKERYSRNIEIFTGLEIDYLKDFGLNPLAIPYLPQLDYYIGSVHSLAQRKNGTYWFVDDHRENLIQGIEELYGGDIKAAVKDYYNNVKELVKVYKPDILGHIDIIKKNNVNNFFFNEDEAWYKETIRRVLSSVKKGNTIVEVNTGGIPRYGQHAMYPSTFILEEICDMGINITVNGDSHHVDHIDYYYEEVYKMVKDIGFKHIMILTKEGWKPYALE
ncbi:MAG: histidinol-phosphatase [Eubacteriales bacterium]